MEERDRAAAPGGTCTNVGCIPSKALLQSSASTSSTRPPFRRARHQPSTNLKMDVAKMVARKDTVVKQNNDGIPYLFKKNKVSFFHGRARSSRPVEGGYEIQVAGGAGGDPWWATGHRRHRLERARELPGGRRRGERAVQRRRAARRRGAQEAGP